MFLREIFLLLSPTDCAHQPSRSPGSCRPHLEWPEELRCSNSCLTALSNASPHLPHNSTFLYTDKKKNNVAYIIYWHFGGSFVTGISGIFLHTKQDGQAEFWAEVWKCCSSGPQLHMHVPWAGTHVRSTSHIHNTNRTHHTLSYPITSVLLCLPWFLPSPHTEAGRYFVRVSMHCSNPLFFSTRENAQPDQKHLVTGKPGSPTGEANGVTNLPGQ